MIRLGRTGRADSRSRGLMNQGYFAAIYIDNGDVTNGDLQPVLDELMKSWGRQGVSARPREDHRGRPEPA